MTRPLLCIGVLLLFVCSVLAQTPCVAPNGIQFDSACLCASNTIFNATAGDCAPLTGASTCHPATVSELDSPLAITLGVGQNLDGSLTFHVDVPMENTRIVTSINFSYTATSSYDYPVAFNQWTRTVFLGVTMGNCDDIFSVTVPIDSAHNLELPLFNTTVDIGANTVTYRGTFLVQTLETLPSGDQRVIVQELDFAYTFPFAVTSTITDLQVLSGLGTTAESNVGQLQNENSVEIELKLTTPYPYQLNWISLAPVNAANPFGTGNPFTLPAYDPSQPIPNVTVSSLSSCDPQAVDTSCPQTTTIKISYDPASTCVIDGLYQFYFAATGCWDTHSSTVVNDCLITDETPLALEYLAVNVSLNLKMGNFCSSRNTFKAAASALVTYSNADFTTNKHQFIANDDSQPTVYFETVLTIEGDHYRNHSILSVTRSCNDPTVTACNGGDIEFDIHDVTDLTGSNPLSQDIKFSIPVSAFTEVTQSTNVIQYNVAVILSIAYDLNNMPSKRSITPTTPAGSGSTFIGASGQVEFSQDTAAASVTKAPSSVSSGGIAGIVVGATAGVVAAAAGIAAFVRHRTLVRANSAQV